LGSGGWVAERKTSLLVTPESFLKAEAFIKDSGVLFFKGVLNENSN
jgi:hypothetical protein